MNTPIVVLVVASSEEEASRIGERLVEEKLVACVNVLPGVRSLFVWKEKLCDTEEVLLIMKSLQGLLDRIVDRVKTLHSYEVPEVVALPVLGGSDDYLRWIEESVS